jgi:accessory gene regulator B
LSYLGFSTKCAEDLARVHHLSEEKQTQVAYAIEILVLNIANAMLTLTLGWAFGVFWGTATCLLTSAAFRHNAGGGHSESPWRCTAVTIIVFPLLALAASDVSTWRFLYIDLISLVSILMGFAFIFKYAPVDNPKAPIVSPIWRKKLKIWALSIMAIIAIIIISLRFSGWEKASEIRMCLALTVLWVSFNLTTLGHQLWCFIDSIELK